jgi:hypothetical protein
MHTHTLTQTSQSQKGKLLLFNEINTGKCLISALNSARHSGGCQLNSYVSVANENAICHISSIDELCDDQEGGRSSEEKEKEDETWLEPARSIT